MTLIKIVNKKVANLPLLCRLVLRYVYDNDNMSYDDEKLMMDSFIGYGKQINPDPDVQYYVQKFAKFLTDGKDGKFLERIELFKKFGIDYRKFHRLPEMQYNSYKEEDFK